MSTGAAGVAGVGAAIAVPGGAGEAVPVGAEAVGVGGGGEVDFGGRRDLPGGTRGVGADSGARRSSEAVCWTVLATAPGETALIRFAERDSRFALRAPATEASSRGTGSRVPMQAMTARFRSGFDWSIFAPALFPARSW